MFITVSCSIKDNSQNIKTHDLNSANQDNNIKDNTKVEDNKVANNYSLKNNEFKPIYSPFIKEYKEMKEITDKSFRLSKELGEVYKSFSSKKDDKLLSGLEPVDILKLNFHAEEIKDVETMYYLMNLSPNINPEHPTLDRFKKQINEDTAWNAVVEKEIKRLRNDIIYIFQYIVNDNQAYIVINFRPDENSDGYIHYRIERNKNSVWKLAWLASQ